MKECAKGLLSRGMRDFTPRNDTLTPVIASVAKQSLLSCVLGRNPRLLRRFAPRNDKPAARTTKNLSLRA